MAKQEISTKECSVSRRAVYWNFITLGYCYDVRWFWAERQAFNLNLKFRMGRLRVNSEVVSQPSLADRMMDKHPDGILTSLQSNLPVDCTIPNISKLPSAITKINGLHFLMQNITPEADRWVSQVKVMIRDVTVFCYRPINQESRAPHTCLWKLSLKKQLSSGKTAYILALCLQSHCLSPFPTQDLSFN